MCFNWWPNSHPESACTQLVKKRDSLGEGPRHPARSTPMSLVKNHVDFRWIFTRRFCLQNNTVLGGKKFTENSLKIHIGIQPKIHKKSLQKLRNSHEIHYEIHYEIHTKFTTKFTRNSLGIHTKFTRVFTRYSWGSIYGPSIWLGECAALSV